MASIVHTFVEWPCSTQLVELDGEVYLLRMTWRDYCESWYLDVETEDGDQVVTGVRIEEGTDLLICADSDLAPPGMLLALQTGTVGGAPAVSTVQVALTGAVATVRPGHTLLDSDGHAWTPVATVVTPGATVLQTMSPEPVALAVGDVLTPGVPAVAGLVVTVTAASAEGSLASVLERTDLGESVLLVYVPAAEVAAAP